MLVRARAPDKLCQVGVRRVVATTTDSPSRGSHGPESKHQVKVRDHLKTIGTERRAQGAEHKYMYIDRYL